jgi:hypothetical protein
MDKDAIRARMRARFETSMEAALEAVESAPDGQWIAGSEWEVRDIFQKLMADSFQELIQTRADGHSAATQAAFSPSGRRSGPAQQGPALRPRADRRRRD